MNKLHELVIDGRKVAIEEYGDPNGKPVFFHHGWPASAVQGAVLDAPARELGLRILSPDRPGVGTSEIHQGRRLLDWPPLIAKVADQLGVDKFRVLGISGGGPYSFALAWGLGARVEMTSVVCGAPPLAELASTAGLHPAYRALLAIYRRRPGVVRGIFRLTRPFALAQIPQAFINFALNFMPPADAAVMRDPVFGKAALANFRGAWRTSADGVFSDAEIYPNAWGFPVEEIQTPVRFWHGREDKNFSWQLADAFAKRVPRCTTFILDGEGHYSLAMRRAPDFLKDLAEASPS